MQTEISRLMSAAVVALFQANGKLLEWGDTFTAPFGLTSARWQILGAIALAGQKQTAPQIAEKMGVSRQGAQKQLNLLVDDGLIVKIPNPSHQRSPHYLLTERGDKLFEKVNFAWQTHANKAGEAFSAEDLETTLRTLCLISRLHQTPASGEQNEA